MVENTARSGDQVRIDAAPQAGDNFSPRGIEAKAGEILLHSGQRVTFAGIAALAMVGRERVSVFERPAVAILATGDEIVELGSSPGDFEIRNSNAYSLAAQVTRAGGIPEILPVARDQMDSTRAMIERGLDSDLLLLSGGVSMGKYDIVEQALAELGAQFYFDGALIQPGKPVVFGEVAGKFFFGLPGNPLSTMVTFEIFARAAVEILGGASDCSLPLCAFRSRAILPTNPDSRDSFPARYEAGRRRGRPASLAGIGGHPHARARKCIRSGGSKSRIVEEGRSDSGAAGMKKLSHYDASGRATMVDVSSKAPTERTATAQALVRIRPGVLKKLPSSKKGNPLEVARIAGISAAKRTSELIPMCHPLMLTHIDVEASLEKKGIRIRATVSTTGQTGVEMEALTAAAVAALTVYDMTKALDKSIEIQDLYLLEKTGGKSGNYKMIRVAIITISDSTVAGTREDGRDPR